MHPLPYGQRRAPTASWPQFVFLWLAYLVAAFVSAVLVGQVIHGAFFGRGPYDGDWIFYLGGNLLTGLAALIAASRWKDFSSIGFLCLLGVVAALGVASFSPGFVCLLLLGR